MMNDEIIFVNQWPRLKYEYADGGRAAAGFKGITDDCVCRSIAIATEQDYKRVYDALNIYAASERITKRNKTRSHARTGVGRQTYERYLKALGWHWRATMDIGTGCTVHLRKGELPAEGRLIVRVSKHMCAVVNGTILDTHNPDRLGERCVYGYWTVDK